MKNHKAKKIWCKVTRTAEISPYTRLDKEKQQISKDASCENFYDQCNNNNNSESKNYSKISSEINAKVYPETKQEKKKRKGWKRFRHAALMTCRYIGLGVSHMSPISTYPASDYFMDYNSWAMVYNNSKKPQYQSNHWTTGVVVNSW